MDEYVTPTCLTQQINGGSGRTFETHVNGSRTVQIFTQRWNVDNSCAVFHYGCVIICRIVFQ